VLQNQQDRKWERKKKKGPLSKRFKKDAGILEQPIWRRVMKERGGKEKRRVDDYVVDRYGEWSGGSGRRRKVYYLSRVLRKEDH